MNSTNSQNFQMPLDRELDNINEEFNNFLHRATEVSNIVHKLASNDANQQHFAMMEADRILNADKSDIVNKMDENDIVLRVKSDRTVLNKKALHKKESHNADTMDQEAFMEEVSRDADRRYKDKLVRTERMETFKTQAAKAFRRAEFAKALCYYNKAIEQIKDSPQLYNNRALTQIKLQRYDRAIEDLKWALRLNENCLRSFLLLAKCFKFQGEVKRFNETVAEAKERNPKSVTFIDETVAEMESALNVKT